MMSAISWIVDLEIMHNMKYVKIFDEKDCFYVSTI